MAACLVATQQMDLSYTNDSSRIARFKRELRNPSMITVILMVLVAATVVLAPFAPGWVSTTRESFDAMAEQRERNEAGISSIGAIVPSQIAPWMAVQARTMIAAEGPLEWKAVSFERGPCDAGNLSQLPVSKYSNAIAQACSSFDEIQQRYSGDCFIASDCNVPEVAIAEIMQTMNIVWDEFSDAGFVLPYTEVEQQVFP
ncbi:MAG: hypothetical protein J4N66_11360 [Chloroflexi bacterium]|nr:hypothetical protein [Chloroflexota bacterium]